MMGYSKYKCLLLGTAIALAPASFAQTDGDDDEARQETVYVTGTPIRDSQMAAIAAKRYADNVVDVLAADTIGRFPDQNLADSLGRVPGLAIERDQGQARFINFRGAPFRYTKIAFDGVDVLGAEDGRIPRFDAFPAVITSRVEVNKAITPDLPGESTIGFINIETFKPSDRDGWSFTGEAGYGKQELGDVDIDKFNGRVSYSNDEFGFLLFGSHNLRGRITDNREYEYEDTNGDDIDDSVVNLDFRSYRGEREDNAYGGRIDFRPTPTSEVFFSTLYSEFIDREERIQYDFDFDPVALGSSGFIDDISVTRSLGAPLYENSTFTNTLGADFMSGDWSVEARLNYTETEAPTVFTFPQSYGGAVGGSYDISDIENPLLFLTQPGQPGTATDVNTLDYASGSAAIIFLQDLDTEAWKAKLDAERELTLFEQPTTVKFGLQYDTREAEGGTGVVFSFSDFATLDFNPFFTNELWDQDFNNTIQGRNFDNQAFQAAWSDIRGGFDIAFDPEDIITIEEDVLALYSMATTEFDWGNIVYGLRAEQTQSTSAGTLVDGDTLIPISVDDDYWSILPSIHLNWDLRDDLKLRISGSTGISRPRYSEMRASAEVDPATFEIEGGNPFLDPETSIGADISLEWYFADASLLSIGAYHRQIDDVIYPATTIVDGGVFAPGIIAPGTPTTFNSFANGDDGELTGLEINFLGTAEDWLPEPFDGLGVSGNLTFVDSEFTAPTLNNMTFSLPGTSETIYNASIFYEKFGLSARLNYQYRDDWLSTTENDSLTEFWAETERVDASLRYTLPEQVYGTNVTFALNGNNLTDERDVRFINTRATPNQVEGFGRRWVFSIRVDY